GWRSAPARDGGGADGAARDRRAGQGEHARRRRLAAQHRADAARHPRGHGGDQQQHQRRTPRRAHPRRRRPQLPRQDAELHAADGGRGQRKDRPPRHRGLGLHCQEVKLDSLLHPSYANRMILYRYVCLCAAARPSFQFWFHSPVLGHMPPCRPAALLLPFYASASVQPFLSRFTRNPRLHGAGVVKVGMASSSSSSSSPHALLHLALPPPPPRIPVFMH
ncbi:phosphoribosylamidoimidazole-succinocarboxamide synthase, partial [Moesziomyces antarcticus T-34]